MKKLFACLIILALTAFAITGCASDKPKQAEQDKQAQKSAESQDSDQSSVSVKPKDGSATVESGQGSISFATDKSVELPKGYPSDKFPVYEKSYIASAIEGQGTYAITAFSKDDVQKVIAFYEKVLEGAKVYMDTKTDTSLTSAGTKDGYAYTINVGKSPEKGYQTSITISLQPAN